MPTTYEELWRQKEALYRRLDKAEANVAKATDDGHAEYRMRKRAEDRVKEIRTMLGESTAETKRNRVRWGKAEATAQRYLEALEIISASCSGWNLAHESKWITKTKVDEILEQVIKAE